MKEYQKINNKPNQPIQDKNDDSRGTYNTNSQIKFKTLALKVTSATKQ